jgi:P27 family predicted phage terminase small subunit
VKGKIALPIEQRIARGKMSKAEEAEAKRSMPARVEGQPEPPEWLDGKALEGWNRFSEILFKRGQLSKETEASLLALSLCYEEWLILKADLRKYGYTQIVTGRDGTSERSRPAAAAFISADNRLRSWLTEFGLTDASRGKVTVSEEHSALANDPLARYGLN